MSLPIPSSHTDLSLLSDTGTSLPRTVAKPVQRELDWLHGRSDIAQARDHARAELTAQAMTNIGSLIATGQSLAHITPESAGHLEALLNAYTIGATQAIARFQ